MAGTCRCGWTPYHGGITRAKVEAWTDDPDRWEAKALRAHAIVCNQGADDGEHRPMTHSTAGFVAYEVSTRGEISAVTYERRDN